MRRIDICQANALGSRVGRNPQDADAFKTDCLKRLRPRQRLSYQEKSGETGVCNRHPAGRRSVPLAGSQWCSASQ